MEDRTELLAGYLSETAPQWVNGGTP